MPEMLRKTQYGSNFLEKDDSAVLQGIAVMLMVFHHLFGFPERVSVPYSLIFLSAESVLSYFGRICIPMLAFLSGYGFTRKMDLQEISGGKDILIKGYCSIGKSLLSFFSRYWLVFFIFVSYGLITGVYQFDLRVFLKSLIGFSDYYNKEWWYTATYIELLAIFPILYLVFSLLRRSAPKLLSIILPPILFITATICLQRFSLPSFAEPLLAFSMGIFVEGVGLLDKLYAKLKRPDRFGSLIGIAVCVLVFLVHMKILPYSSLRPFFGSLLVCALGLVIKAKWMKRSLNKVLFYVGKYGVYIWLTHTFFAYYYFQPVVYWPYYSWIIFIWCLSLSVITGVVFESALKLLSRLIGKSTSRSRH